MKYQTYKINRVYELSTSNLIVAIGNITMVLTVLETDDSRLSYRCVRSWALLKTCETCSQLEKG